jgi:UDP-N-acetylmuramate dehydrogenase
LVASISNLQDEFRDISRADVPLAPYTWLKIGGPAQLFMEPRNVDELQKIVTRCHEGSIPVHVLGGGSNVLIRDDGVSGVVIHIKAPAFAEIKITGNRVSAGAAALLSHLVTQTVEAGLGGLDALVGIPGTVGGAIKGNAGGRTGSIGQYVKSVSVITGKGERFTRTDDELSFTYRTSSINEILVLGCELELVPEDPEAIAHRMKKLWVMKKNRQPMSFQSAGCIFKNPRGSHAGELIEQAGLKGTKVGNCEVSDRHANFIVTHEGATSADVLNLIDLVRSKVAEKHGIKLELEVQIW